MSDETESMYQRLAAKAMAAREKRRLKRQQPKAKRSFTPAQVREMRQYRAEGLRYCQIALLMQTAWSNVYSVCERRTYRDVE